MNLCKMTNSQNVKLFLMDLYTNICKQYIKFNLFLHVPSVALVTELIIDKSSSS
jgi:hypothetical protein